MVEFFAKTVVILSLAAIALAVALGRALYQCGLADERFQSLRKGGH